MHFALWRPLWLADSWPTRTTFLRLVLSAFIWSPTTSATSFKNCPTYQYRKSAKSLCDKYQDLFGNKLATDSIFDQSVFPIQLEQVSVEKDGETILAPCDLTIHAGERLLSSEKAERAKPPCSTSYTGKSILVRANSLSRTGTNQLSTLSGWCLYLAI